MEEYSLSRIAMEGEIGEDNILTCNVSECKGDSNTILHLLSTAAVAILKRMAEEELVEKKDPTAFLPQIVDKRVDEWLSVCFYPSVNAAKSTPTCYVDMEEFRKQIGDASADPDGSDAVS